MTVSLWCVLVAALLPIASAGIAKWGAFGIPRREGGYDNHDPRDWMARQTGYRKRANAAQANTFEALPFFFAALVIAQQMQAPQGRVDLLAVAFVTLRVMYVALYLADKPLARSLVWAVALAVNVALLFAGVWATSS
jgi:uncharacterized MAPEG superfamily protein